jgi:hypothetical protein
VDIGLPASTNTKPAAGTAHNRWVALAMWAHALLADETTAAPNSATQGLGEVR